ncbi:MAG: hypothetical protein ACQEXJ_05365 [Myxococcota bacterium]
MGFSSLGAYARERCARTERWAADAPEPVPDDFPEVQDEPLPEGARALDRHIRRLAGEVGARDLEMGDAARCFFASGRWRALGYASEWQYATWTACTAACCGSGGGRRG